MKKLLLIVKGTKEQARQAARDRGIHAHFLNKVSDFKAYYVSGYVKASDIDSELKLGNWFIEDIPLPYPAGTLLYYGIAIARP